MPQEPCEDSWALAGCVTLILQAGHLCRFYALPGVGGREQPTLITCSVVFAAYRGFAAEDPDTLPLHRSTSSLTAVRTILQFLVTVRQHEPHGHARGDDPIHGCACPPTGPPQQDGPRWRARLSIGCTAALAESAWAAARPDEQADPVGQPGRRHRSNVAEVERQ